MPSSKFGRQTMRTNRPPPVCISKTKEQGTPVQAHGVLGSLVTTLPADDTQIGAPATITLPMTGDAAAHQLTGSYAFSSGRQASADITWDDTMTSAAVHVYVQASGGFSAVYRTGNLAWDATWPMRYNGVTAYDQFSSKTITLSSSVS